MREETKKEMTLTTYINNHGKKAGVVALSSWTGGIVVTENNDGTFDFDFNEHLLLLGITVYKKNYNTPISLIGDETIDDYGNRLIIMYYHKEIDLDFCNLFPVFRQKLRYKKLSRILLLK